MMDWSVYLDNLRPLPVIVNRTFITGIFVLAGITTTLLLLRKEKEDFYMKNRLKLTEYRNIVAAVLLALSFIVPFLELAYQINVYYRIAALKVVILSIYVYAYLFVVLLLLRTSGRLFRVMIILAWIALFLYVAIFHRNVLSLREGYVYGKNITSGDFIFHYLAIPFVAGIVILLRKKLKFAFPEGLLTKFMSWFASFFFIFIASAELDNILVLVREVTIQNYHPVLEWSHKAGYPILWGVCAFILVMLGIRNQEKTYRIQAFAVFALIILKLFLFDVWNMSEGGRIAAFVFLGIVLLVVSFLYQKLKNLLLDPGDNNVRQKNHD
jgi:hypothetical protein